MIEFTPKLSEFAPKLCKFAPKSCNLGLSDRAQRQEGQTVCIALHSLQGPYRLTTQIGSHLLHSETNLICRDFLSLWSSTATDSSSACVWLFSLLCKPMYVVTCPYRLKVNSPGCMRPGGAGLMYHAAPNRAILKY